MAPSVGRIVHFCPDDDTNQVKAAIITRVWSDTVVNLTIFNGNSISYRTSVHLSEQFEPNKWKWPERLEE